MTKNQIVYLIGIAIFGLGYYAIKTRLDNDVILVIGAAAYLIFLHVLAKRFNK